MLNKSSDHNPNYLAQIVQLDEQIKHPKADRLIIWLVQGNRVITDLSYKKGDICIYFPIECKLNHELLAGLCMYEDKNLNVDNTKKGYVGSKGRVRAVKLREEPSMGLILRYTDINGVLGNYIGDGKTELPIGFEFDTWNDELICEKYIPPIQGKGWLGNSPGSSKNRVKRFNRMVDNQFRLHSDTIQLRKNIHLIEPDDIISITNKLHGTSWVVGNVLVKRKLSIIDRVTKWFGVKIKEEEYDILYSSRSVIKNKFINDNPQHYYGTDLWGDIKDNLVNKIPKGITLYGECVGWTRNGAPIQKNYIYGYTNPVFTKLEVISSEIGVEIPYKEGVHYGIYIYRITNTNVDGVKTEYTWQQIKEYCTHYNLKHVPEFYYGCAKDWDRTLDISLHWNASLLEGLEKQFLEKDCNLCGGGIPSEGVVVNKSGLFDFEAFKLKSFRFLEGETKLLDEGLISIEDEQS